MICKTSSLQDRLPQVRSEGQAKTSKLNSSESQTDYHRSGLKDRLNNMICKTSSLQDRLPQVRSEGQAKTSKLNSSESQTDYHRSGLKGRLNNMICKAPWLPDLTVIRITDRLPQVRSEGHAKTWTSYLA